MAPVLLALTHLLLPHTVQGIKVSDLFYMNTSPASPGNCYTHASRLDAGLHDVKEWIDTDGAIAALDLLAASEGRNVQAARDWDYYYRLFVPLFYGPDMKERYRGEGLRGLPEWREVRKNFLHLQSDLNRRRRNKTPQVFCTDAWQKLVYADETYPLDSDENPRSMAEAYPAAFVDDSWGAIWYRQTHPPGVVPTKQNSFVKRSPDIRVCMPGTDASTNHGFDTLTWCSPVLENDPSTLRDCLSTTPIVAGMSINDNRLRSLSENWVHEMIHWTPNLKFRDEAAVHWNGSPELDENGVPVPAYGFQRCVALAEHDAVTARRNVEGYVMFAKGVKLRKLQPGWSFLSGVAEWVG